MKNEKSNMSSSQQVDSIKGWKFIPNINQTLAGRRSLIHGCQAEKFSKPGVQNKKWPTIRKKDVKDNQNWPTIRNPGGTSVRVFFSQYNQPKHTFILGEGHCITQYQPSHYGCTARRRL